MDLRRADNVVDRNLRLRCLEKLPLIRNNLRSCLKLLFKLISDSRLNCDVFLERGVTLILAPAKHVKEATIAAHFYRSRRRNMVNCLRNDTLIAKVKLVQEFGWPYATLLNCVSLLYKCVNTV